MTIPALLPDELALGYLGRVARMNLLKDEQQTIQLLRASLATAGGNVQVDSMVHVLAALASLSPEKVLAQHTMLPFARVVRPAASCAWFSQNHDRFARMALTYPRVPAKGLRFCLRCVQEDVSFLGLSFWRRSHQLYGVVYCAKHRCGLNSAVSRRWIDLPEHLQSTDKSVDKDVVEDALSNAVIARYEEICSAFSLRHRPWPMESVNRLIRARARQVLSPDSNGALPLSKYAVEKVGGAWLSRHFPNQAEQCLKRNSDSLGRTVRTPTVPLATQYYALALALLFDCTDEALCYLNQAESDASLLVTPSVGGDRRGESIDRISIRLGDARDRAIHAILAGSSIRDAAKHAGVLGPDLEDFVIACASEKLSQLSLKTH